MARKKKPKRRIVYSHASCMPDGSVFACGPDRKPTEKRIKNDGIFIDEDGVFRESKYGATDWHAWEVDQRVKLVTILANRLNTRRAIRELILPELEAIQSTLADIQKRLERIEQSSTNQSHI